METAYPTVALVYDFDGTLSPGNMQEYDFIPAVGKSNHEFWSDSNEMAREADADPILTYMARMIHEARAKNISLTREAFQRSGRCIRLYPGVEEWFGRINAYGATKGLNIVHYINSSGIREMIEGTPIADKFRKIYACSFLYDADGVAYWPGVAVNYTNKTQFIFKINKGVEPVWDTHAVNEYIEESLRPVPFRRMIYFGDGTTDIPCMRLVKSSGGYSIAVYSPGDGAGRTGDFDHTSAEGAGRTGGASRTGDFDHTSAEGASRTGNSGYAKNEDAATAHRLVKENRVNFVSPADYRPGGELDRIVHTIIDKIAAEVELAKL